VREATARPPVDPDKPAGGVVRGERGPWRATRRRGRVPYLSFGALLVLICVLGYAYYAFRLGDRVPVLAVAQPVGAGQGITAADLKRVPAANDPSLGLIPASQASEVVGRTAVVPLLPGTLLTRNLIGDAAFPPVGKVVASVALKPGQYPRGLVAGAHVAVFVSAATAGGHASGGSSAPSGGWGSRLSAVVLGVDPGGDGQGNTVVTLLLDASDATSLAGGDGVVLMQTAPAGG
jgi:hypothetical protein